MTPAAALAHVAVVVAVVLGSRAVAALARWAIDRRRAALSDRYRITVHRSRWRRIRLVLTPAEAITLHAVLKRGLTDRLGADRLEIAERNLHRFTEKR